MTFKVNNVVHIIGLQKCFIVTVGGLRLVYVTRILVRRKYKVPISSTGNSGAVPCDLYTFQCACKHCACCPWFLLKDHTENFPHTKWKLLQNSTTPPLYQHILFTTHLDAHSKVASPSSSHIVAACSKGNHCQRPLHLCSFHPVRASTRNTLPNLLILMGNMK